MKSPPHLLQSCTVSFAFSFVVPLLLIALVRMGLSALSYLPGLTLLSQDIGAQLRLVLEIFGQGSSVQGCFVIAGAFGLVGVLFDICIPHRYGQLS